MDNLIQGMKVLILEKEQIVKKDIDSQLVRNGYKVIGEDAMQEADFIIIGQFFYLEEIKKQSETINSKTKFIFLTTHTEDGHVRDKAILNRSIFISKPVDVETIIRLIRLECQSMN